MTRVCPIALISAPLPSADYNPLHSAAQARLRSPCTAAPRRPCRPGEHRVAASPRASPGDSAGPARPAAGVRREQRRPAAGRRPGTSLASVSVPMDRDQKRARPATTARSASRRRPRSGRSSWRSAAGRSGAAPARRASMPTAARRAPTTSSPPPTPRAPRPSAGAGGAPRVGGGARSRRPGAASAARCGNSGRGAPGRRGGCSSAPSRSPRRTRTPEAISRLRWREPAAAFTRPPATARYALARRPREAAFLFNLAEVYAAAGLRARACAFRARGWHAVAASLFAGGCGSGVTPVTVRRRGGVLPSPSRSRRVRRRSVKSPVAGSAPRAGRWSDAGFRDSFKG